MNTEILTTLLNQLLLYIAGLDWTYILTFILIAHIVNTDKSRRFIKRLTGSEIRTRYRVVILGLGYGILLYFLRGFDISAVEVLLRSFIFTLVFHKLIIDTLLSYLTGTGSNRSTTKNNELV